jgi:DNA polymerase-4
LARLGISTIGQIAQRSPRGLMQRFGSHGYDLWQHACGIDKREIVTERESKSISSETTFVRDVEEWDELHGVLQEQAAEVAEHLRRQQLQATTVKIKLRWTDFTTPTRQTTLPRPTDQREIIEEAATLLLRQLWHSQQPVRLLGVGVSGLSPVRQLSLWEAVEAPAAESPVAAPQHESGAHTAETEKRNGLAATQSNPQPPDAKQLRIQQAIDLLQERYGKRVVRLGIPEADA